MARIAVIDLQQQLQYEGVGIEFEVLLPENGQKLAYLAVVIQLGSLLLKLHDIFLRQCGALLVLLKLT